MLIALVGAVAVTAAFPVVWWALSGERAPASVTRNLTSGTAAPDLRSAVLAHSATDRALRPLTERWTAQARRMTPAGRVEALERRILLAGAPEAWTVDRVLAVKLLLASTGAVLGVLSLLGGLSPTHLLFAVLAVALGWFGPDGLLRRRSDTRQAAIRASLPDVIDQLAITVEAGLGFEAALARVGRTGEGPLAEEIVRTLQDVQAGMSRREALDRLLDRTDVDELDHFVVAVHQSERYGVPIGRVLRTQSSEQRIKRRQRAEEAAMKLPVKILFPLVFCVLPTIFIVLLGPAAIRITDALG